MRLLTFLESILRDKLYTLTYEIDEYGKVKYGKEHEVKIKIPIGNIRVNEFIALERLDEWYLDLDMVIKAKEMNINGSTKVTAINCREIYINTFKQTFEITYDNKKISGIVDRFRSMFVSKDKILIDIELENWNQIIINLINIKEMNGTIYITNQYYEDQKKQYEILDKFYTKDLSKAIEDIINQNIKKI